MIRMKRLFVMLLLLVAAMPAAAQAPSPEGRWALRVGGGRTLAILELARDAAGSWTGRLLRPDRFTFSGSPDSDLTAFSDIAGPVVTRAIMSASPEGDGLRLAIAGRAAGDSDAYLFAVQPDGTASLALQGFPAPPFQLVRADAAERVAAGWEESRAYPADREWPTSAEMTAIFEADQADRQAGPAIDWAVVTPRDTARRARTRALLDAGGLHSGADFYHAAFVLQHGGEAGDYLLAHTLAVIAAARGRADATWIAAATLDRYLQAIGQPQIYGTQFSLPQGQPATQEPYDRALVSDALRRALGVPGLEAQERQRAGYGARRR